MSQEPPTSQSVYDLGEDEQLALALQQSLADEAVNSNTGAGAVAPASSDEGYWAPETSHWQPHDVGTGMPLPPEEVMRSAQFPDDIGVCASASGALGEVDLVGSTLGAIVPPPPPPSACDPWPAVDEACPEWTPCQGPEDAAGGPPAFHRLQQPASPPAPPPPPPAPEQCHLSSAADAAGGNCLEGSLPPSMSEGMIGVNHGHGSYAPPPLRSEPEETARACGNPIVDAAVQRALEFATARQFDEAEQCLARLASEHPEVASTREFTAAVEAVAMCKQFHGGGS